LKKAGKATRQLPPGHQFNKSDVQIQVLIVVL
jgi:hypothetical protein